MGPGELAEFGGRMKKAKYLEILQEVMIPTVRNVYPEGQIYFIQDNCSVHRSRLVSEWFATQSDIKVIEWPSKSKQTNQNPYISVIYFRTLWPNTLQLFQFHPMI